MKKKNNIIHKGNSKRVHKKKHPNTVKELIEKNIRTQEEKNSWKNLFSISTM